MRSQWRPDDEPLCGAGSLAERLPMTPLPAEIEAVLVNLAATPGRLAALSAGLTEAQLHCQPAGEPWSASATPRRGPSARLRRCVGQELNLMLQQPHPTLRYVSPRAWMRKSGYAALAFSVSLAAFTRQRDDLCQSLRAGHAAPPLPLSLTGANRPC